MNLKFGVPCSQLKDKIKDVDVYCTSEAQAMGLAAGCILCGKETTVYLQNSGLGHCVDIITSLYKPYDLPFPNTILSIRHAPHHHYYMGKITKPLLDLMEYYKVQIIEQEVS